MAHRLTAAARLGIGEEFLAEIAIDLEPEDGVLRVHDSTEEGCYGFTSLLAFVPDSR